MNKVAQTKDCLQCKSAFSIYDDELELYDKIAPEFEGRRYPIPVPEICPKCRKQRRLSFRNERQLYRRECAHSGEEIISIYSTDKPYKVYDQQVWWSDDYDPLEYGRDFDFSKPFFEQFHELDLAVPKPAIQNTKSENCAYTNYSSENKNGYLLVGALGAEDCYHGYRIFYSKDVVDCYDMYKCELCYECLESSNLFSCCYSRNCHNSSSLFWCDNCISCNDCIGCINLRNKSCCIFNTQYSKEDYLNAVQELLGDLASVKREIAQLRNRSPHRFAQSLKCQNSTGSQILNCKNCFDAFTLKNSEDCRFISTGEKNNDCIDCNFFDNSELQYNSSNLEKNYGLICGSLVWYTSDSAYCTTCFNSQNLFGCSGMKKHRYCVLNKQYDEKEYNELVPRIIEHMQSTGEWGWFFPISISPFGYNETVAHEYIPLSREEALFKEYNWKESEHRNYREQRVSVPENIQDVSDAISEQVLACSDSGKNYKIIAPELAFYRKMGLPLPTKCPDVRHKERMARRNPEKLWDRQCSKCSSDLLSPFNPEQPEIVYCETCFQQSVG